MAVLHVKTMKLSDVCVYTIIDSEKLMKGGTSFSENKRWASVQRHHLPEARDRGLELPIVFANASHCSELLAWTTLEEVTISDTATDYTVGDLYDVGRMTRPDLIVLSTKESIPDGDIRPYRLCETPRVLKLIAKQPRRWRH